MNNAKFFSFDSDQDLDAVPAGTQFTATWRMRNNGNETWGAGFKIVHINASRGSQRFGNPASFNFEDVASRGSCEPNALIDISLTFTAPTKPHRRYFTDWQLQDERGRGFGDLVWLRLVTTTAPITSTGGFRRSSSKFVDDHSIPDGTTLEEGESFRKQWVVRNNGQRKWGTGYRLVFTNGENGMAGTFSVAIPETDPGEEVVLSIDMVAPPGRNDAYISAWRLHDDRDIPFGDTFWVKIFSSRKPVDSSITFFSQNDRRWKHRILGKGPKTLGQFGCLLCCCAMMMTGYGEETDPWQLNNRINALPNNGFSGSNMFFMGPALAYGHLKFFGNFKPRANTGATFATFDRNLINRIDTSLAQGHGVMIQVDFDPNNAYNPGVEQHWVLAISRRGNDYTVIDPLDGEQISLLSKYGKQNRPQDPNEALKDAIKSALFYRSTTRTIDFPNFADVDTDAGSDGLTEIGTTDQLVYTGPAWKFNRCLIGLHDRADRHPQPADHALATGRFDSIKVQSGVTVHEMQAYDARFYLCRLFESWNGRDVKVKDFVKSVLPDIRPLVSAGVKYFEFHNEPNMTHEGLRARGIKGSWSNGAEFADYFLEGRRLLQKEFPGIKVGFPGVSPGPSGAYQFGHDKGFRMNDAEFLEGAEEGLRGADFICLHAYYLSMAEVKGAAIESVREFRRRYPEKLLFVTEFSNPDPQKNISAAEKGVQAKAFYQLCNEIPGLGAAYYFLVSGPGWDHQALRVDNDRHRVTETGVMGKMLT